MHFVTGMCEVDYTNATVTENTWSDYPLEQLHCQDNRFWSINQVGKIFKTKLATRINFKKETKEKMNRTTITTRSNFPNKNERSLQNISFKFFSLLTLYSFIS